jgi:hypothetical protein
LLQSGSASKQWNCHAFEKYDRRHVNHISSSLFYSAGHLHRIFSFLLPLPELDRSLAGETLFLTTQVGIPYGAEISAELLDDEVER